MERINFRAEYAILKSDFTGYKVVRRVADDTFFIAEVGILQKIKQHSKRKNQDYHAIKQLDHPNILKLKRWYEDGQVSFQLYEHSQFNMLSIIKERELTECQAVSVIIQIANGLRYIHSKGFYARLISVSSVFLQQTSPGKVIYKLGLLGSLKLNEAGRAGFSHAPQLLIGNRQVKNSPDQELDILTKMPVGPPTDFFSLGVIFFELLTKTPLFPNVEAITALDKTPFLHYIKQKFPQADQQINADLKQILSRLIVYQKENRIGAEQLIAKLQIIHKQLSQRPGQKEIYGQGMLYFELAKLVERQQYLTREAKEYAVHQIYKIFWLHTVYIQIQHLPAIQDKIREVEQKIKEFQGKQLSDKKLQRHAKTSGLHDWLYQHPASLTGASLQQIKNNQYALYKPYKHMIQNSLNPRTALALILAMSFRKNVNELYKEGQLLSWIEKKQLTLVRELAIKIETAYFK